MKSRKLAFLGLLIALAFVLSYIEFMLPINIGIPGAKVGLANLVVVVALYTLGERDAFTLSIIRVLLVGLTFGNMAMMMYSAAGAALSFIAMFTAKRTGKLSQTGVSVIGGVFHNVGQIVVAMFVLETSAIFYYLPFLIIVGTLSGVIIGFVSGMIITRVKKIFRWV
ncbi:MAG: Gx transporter family protein [Lachnospiraceae bacterium]|nr:Gx transporter family protein [Lachnospiraceae bacterium]